MAEEYLLFIYVFRLYIYLVEVRGFSMMSSGLVAALPWLAGLCLTPLEGLAADRIAVSRGRPVAAEYIISVGYTTAGVLLFVAAYAPARGFCVAVFCLSVGFRRQLKSRSGSPRRTLPGQTRARFDEHSRHRGWNRVHLPDSGTGGAVQLAGRIRLSNGCCIILRIIMVFDREGTNDRHHAHPMPHVPNPYEGTL